MPEKSLLLIESQYFPSILFFKKAIKYPVLCLEANENYQKRSYRNRCHIAGANGIQMLTIPLNKGKNEQQPILETSIAYTSNWQKIHWQSIQSAYGKSPFFEFYADEIKPVFEKKWTHLFDLNLSIIQVLKEILQLSFEISTSNTYVKNPNPETEDARNQLSPKNQEKIKHLAPIYPQVFEAKNGFLPNLSILDLLFCLGPETSYYLDE